MAERAVSSSGVLRGPPTPELRREGAAPSIPRARSFVRARALAPIAVALIAAGCLDTVSLGEGPPETHGSGDPEIPITGLPTTSGDTDPLPDRDPCSPGPDTDVDGDGFTPSQGDCDDCDPAIGPDAVELPTREGEASSDEDCDGLIDEAPTFCDEGLKTGELSPYSAVRALDLCQMATPGRWGVVSAAWVLPDGTQAPTGPKFDVGHGILPGFGPNMPVRGGARLLSLSTGAARLPGDPEFSDLRGLDKGYTSKPIEGLEATTACSTSSQGTPHDAAALEVILRAPQNADSFAFDFDFYTFEFPEELCSTHDDLFVALLSPPASGPGGTNIAFDGAGNVVSVNSARFEVCKCSSGPPCVFHGIEYGCGLGATQLLGTGFGAAPPAEIDHGATGWLVAEGPVEPGGLFRVRFAVQDAEDGLNDSTVLLDHFRFRGAPPSVPRAATH